MLGVKLLSRYASGLFAKQTSYLSDTEFAKWMASKGVFECIFLPTAQLPFLKLSDDIFRSYIRTHLMTPERYIQLFNLLDMCDSETRKFLFKLLNSVYLRLEYQDF